jgi:hypothetical protein
MAITNGSTEERFSVSMSTDFATLELTSRKSHKSLNRFVFGPANHMEECGRLIVVRERGKGTQGLLKQWLSLHECDHTHSKPNDLLLLWSFVLVEIVWSSYYVNASVTSARRDISSISFLLVSRAIAVRQQSANDDCNNTFNFHWFSSMPRAWLIKAGF